jgi:hypothetical protein
MEMETSMDDFYFEDSENILGSLTEEAIPDAEENLVVSDTPARKPSTICPTQNKTKDNIIDFDKEMEFLRGKKDLSVEDLKRLKQLQQFKKESHQKLELLKV